MSKSNYLVLKLGAFGDLSFFLPALEQIQAHDPEAKITWIVGEAYADFVKQIPQVHRVLSVQERKLFHGTLWERWQEVFRLWSRLEFHYQQVWIGHRTLSALFLLRFRVLGEFYQLVRKPSRWTRLIRNEIVVPPLVLQESHAFKLLAETALKKTIPTATWKVNYSWVPPSSMIDQVLPQRPRQAPQEFRKVRYITIHLGGGQNGKTEFLLKQWPHWFHFLRLLANQTPDLLVLVGAPPEQAWAEDMLTRLDLKERVVSLVGKTTFMELLAIIQGSHRFIGVDSGPLHFADSLGIPSLGLYGPTSTVSWGLLGNQSHLVSENLSCSPCYRDQGEFPSCPYERKCMNDLTPEKALRSIPQ